MKRSVHDVEWTCGESMRIVRMCHPGWIGAGRITCPAARWELWRDEVFQPVMVPAIHAAWGAASERDARAVVSVDKDFDGRLGPVSARSSRRAGGRLTALHHAPPGERAWMRYAESVKAGESPGHLVIMLAVRAAAFHLPPRAVMTACLFLELRGGGRPEGECGRIVDEIVGAVPAMPELRAA